VRPEQPAGRATGYAFDPCGGRGQAGGKGVRRHHHEPARAAMQRDRVTFVGDAPHDRLGPDGDVLVDEEERGACVRIAQSVEERRCPRRVGAVVEGQVQRRRLAGREPDVPERLRRA
jgi:hypothetical protein